jgi:hypothetical protein
MITIKVETNLSATRAYLSGIQKQARFATAVALTRTAQDLQRAVPAALERSLDNPTEFTKRGTYLLPAKRDKLRAEVGFKRTQAKYMALQIGGGVRSATAAGIKLPGNIQLNAFGNIPRGLIARLKAAAESGKLNSALAKRLDSFHTVNDLAARRLGVYGNRRKRAAAIQLFYGRPVGKGWEKAPVGIWRRIPPAVPGGKGKLVPVIVFEDTPARYRPRFNFARLARETVAARFATNFETALRNALATAR